MAKWGDSLVDENPQQEKLGVTIQMIQFYGEYGEPLACYSDIVDGSQRPFEELRQLARIKLSERSKCPKP